LSLATSLFRWPLAARPWSLLMVVANPPPSPLLIFDGDCSFCRYWADAWKDRTGDAVEYAAAQHVAGQFPEIPTESLRQSVQLVVPDGHVYGGAEAVFRTLAFASRGRWRHRFALWSYQSLAGVRPATEASYHFIASHRGLFYWVTRILWGKRYERQSYALARWVFLRLLGCVYFVSFLSLATQITGLIGQKGLLPASRVLEILHQQVGPARYWYFPTLAWLSSSDGFLKFLAGGGAAISLLVIAGTLTGPALALLWLFYLSLVTIGGDFMSFQWDVLLLEAGFLAIFLAGTEIVSPPWRRSRSRRAAEILKSPDRRSGTAEARDAQSALASSIGNRQLAGSVSCSPSPVPSALLWLLRWLLFRLMLSSGLAKLLSGDPTWRDLTALDYHYFTQPLPTPLAWYAEQLPQWFQKFSCAAMFAIELGIPFLIFTPRRLRHWGAALTILLQVLIALTGNYTFFNLLTIALCVTLLDDALLRRFLPRQLVHSLVSEAAESAQTGGRPARRPPAAQILTATLAVFLIVGGVVHIPGMGGLQRWLPRQALEIVDGTDPLHLVNGYGLFAVMTTSRLEIIVQGSNDGQKWRDYEFKFKPGDPRRRPPWVEPFQPRLDWQMWFAALGSYSNNRWFVNLMARLLEGSPDVLSLLAKNPFPHGPPRYVRAVTYEYHFTNFAERRATGDWWRREPTGTYFPMASLRR